MLRRRRQAGTGSDMAHADEERDGVIVELSSTDGGPGRGSRAWRALAPVGVLVVLAVVVLVVWQGSAPGPAPSATAPATTGPATASPPGSAASTIEPPPVPEFAQPSRLLFELNGHAPQTELVSGAVPPEAERLALLVGCSGSGTLLLNLDGVLVPFDCARGLLDAAFVPPLDLETTLRLEAAGELRYLVSVRSWTPVSPVFRPPVLRLSGGATTVLGFAGCGIAFRLADGTERAESCGPSWMPLPDDRAVTVTTGAELVLSIDDAWAITGVEAAVAVHDEIVPSGRDPRTRPHGIAADGGARAVIPPLAAGDFGIRLTVSAQLDGRAFTAPYYFRVLVVD
jgi:hypothetical protein